MPAGQEHRLSIDHTDMRGSEPSRWLDSTRLPRRRHSRDSTRRNLYAAVKKAAAMIWTKSNPDPGSVYKIFSLCLSAVPTLLLDLFCPIELDQCRETSHAAENHRPDYMRKKSDFEDKIFGRRLAHADSQCRLRRAIGRDSPRFGRRIHGKWGGSVHNRAVMYRKRTLRPLAEKQAG